MKILLLNYEFPPMGGGAGNATYNIARELAKLGHHVDVLTSKIKPQREQETIAGFNVYRVPSWRKGIHDCGMRGAYSFLFFAGFKLQQLIRSNQYDILHYFFSLPTGLLSLLPGPHRRLPYIVSLRGSDVPHYDIYNKKLKVFHWLLKPITKHIWQKALKVVALSEGLKLTALETYPTQKIVIIPNGIEADLFKPAEKPLPITGQFKLILVSRLIERKGIQHVLQALSELNDKSIKLLIVGTGSYETHLKELGKTLGLDDTVTFHGFCLRTELPKLYNRHDCFILPSMAESFGIVFAEAMACGLPIIGGRTGGVPDLIKSDNGILVEPGNIEEIKNAILNMQASPAKRKKLGHNNRTKVVNYYNWKSIAEKYMLNYRPKRSA
ncbi:MAG TPA: glycosyltransferase family 1 protein [Gammaproteobacteria bacterium]|nr:glycosyltransferase family 1 protein [Gammaproteobacteria bacterium]